MKILSAAALIASSFSPVALPALVSVAAANPSNGNQCNFTMSSSAGWSCDQDVLSADYYSVAQATFSGGDLVITCQDYVRATADYAGINPAGHAVGAFSSSGVTTDEAVGGPYDGSASGCNYPEP